MTADTGYMSQQVDQQVRQAAAAHGARVVRGVTLEVNGRASAYDYILLDRHGFLIVAVEPYPGRGIVGSRSHTQWKAHGRGEKTESFANPFSMNEQRIGDLKEALVVCGRRIADEYFGHLIVFGGSDLSDIKVSDVDRLKLVDARVFEQALQARSDFAPNAGIMEPGQIDDLVSLLGTLDRTDSRGPHAAQSQIRSGRKGWLGLGRAERVSQVSVSDGSVGLAPVAPRLGGDRYPTATRPNGSRASGLLAFLLLVAAAVWLFLFGGYGMLATTAASLLAPVSTPRETQSVPGATSDVAVGLDAALAQYEQAAPEQYSTTTDRTSPEVTNTQGMTTYTWHYVPTKGPQAGKQRWIALTFDGTGQLRGVTGP